MVPRVDSLLEKAKEEACVTSGRQPVGEGKRRSLWYLGQTACWRKQRKKPVVPRVDSLLEKAKEEVCSTRGRKQQVEEGQEAVRTEREANHVECLAARQGIAHGAAHPDRPARASAPAAGGERVRK